MASRLDSIVDALVDAIQDKMHGDLETLVNLWVRCFIIKLVSDFTFKEEMGLSD